MIFDGKRVLITGGTGSLGKVLVRRLLSGVEGTPEQIVVFSRDEAKQHQMRLDYTKRDRATDEIIYRNFESLLAFRIGDVRDHATLRRAVRDAHIVFNAAALKQVPTCEYFPFEAVRTNIVGAQNVVRAVDESGSAVEVVVGISTDKACKPINVMGMTKALQERVFVEANLGCTNTRFVCARYGNVIASRGSVLPLFLQQIDNGGPVTITEREMTRFLLSLDDAVDTIISAVKGGKPGETYIPRVPSARIVDVADVLIDGRDIPIEVTGIRPGEKIHEILVSDEESYRTTERDGYYVIRPMLPELNTKESFEPALVGEFSSKETSLQGQSLRELIAPHVEMHMRGIIE